MCGSQLCFGACFLRILCLIRTIIFRVASHQASVRRSWVDVEMPTRTTLHHRIATWNPIGRIHDGTNIPRCRLATQRTRTVHQLDRSFFLLPIHFRSLFQDLADGSQPKSSRKPTGDHIICDNASELHRTFFKTCHYAGLQTNALALDRPCPKESLFSFTHFTAVVRNA